mgnify:CR=1 FL=1
MIVIKQQHGEIAARRHFRHRDGGTLGRIHQGHRVERVLRVSLRVAQQRREVLQQAAVEIPAVDDRVGGHPGDAFLEKASSELEHAFHIGHSTIQLELGDASPCKFAPNKVV